MVASPKKGNHFGAHIARRPPVSPLKFLLLCMAAIMVFTFTIINMSFHMDSAKQKEEAASKEMLLQRELLDAVSSGHALEKRVEELLKQQQNLTRERDDEHRKLLRMVAKEKNIEGTLQKEVKELEEEKQTEGTLQKEVRELAGDKKKLESVVGRLKIAEAKKQEAEAEKKKEGKVAAAAKLKVEKEVEKASKKIQAYEWLYRYKYISPPSAKKQTHEESYETLFKRMTLEHTIIPEPFKITVDPKNAKFVFTQQTKFFVEEGPAPKDLEALISLHGFKQLLSGLQDLLTGDSNTQIYSFIRDTVLLRY
jgi:hypothetical protein